MNAVGVENWTLARKTHLILPLKSPSSHEAYIPEMTITIRLGRAVAIETCRFP